MDTLWNVNERCAMKRLSFLLSLVLLTGCAHMTRQEWHDVLLGPRAPSWREVRHQSAIEQELNKEASPVSCNASRSC
jgi:hypothetical protein